MAFLKIFKGKKKELERKPEKEVKKGIKEVAKKESKKKIEEKLEVIKPQPSKAKKEEVKIAPRVLSRPQITEKATLLQERNQYIFQVFPSSTKPEVKKAVEEIYGVNVEKVRVVSVRRKRKRLGRSLGWKKGYKKAVVTLRKGQAIEILPR